MSDRLKKIKSRGYWRVVIRPATFKENRISNISHLFPLVQRCSVQLRGWDYPHVDTQTPAAIEKDWAGQEFEWEQFLEIWRIYQSGQFLHVFGMVEDWLSPSKWPTGQTWTPGKVLMKQGALVHFAEIFEFAARLALTEAGDQTMHIGITVNGLRSRVLYSRSEEGLPSASAQASIDSLPYEIDVPQAELIAEARRLAIEPAAQLFRRFGKDIPEPTLRELLDRQQR